MSAERLVMMFHDDKVYSFERTDDHSNFTFGGPFELGENLLGIPTGLLPLQVVARLSLNLIPELWEVYRYHDLLLIYGFTYDGCEVKYRKALMGIEILELWPAESSDNFPYRNYPPILPYVPMKLSETRFCTYREFADEFPNMAVEQPADLIIVVPPPATVGVSLWGSSGDREGVVVVFECSLEDKIVRAYNRCG